VVILRSRFRYTGPPKLGGRLRAGDEVLHLVSDAGAEAEQRAELQAFVADAGLPRSLLNNPHLLKPGRPHLDVWGGPARKALRRLAAGRGGPERRGRTRACVPRRDPPDSTGGGGRRAGPVPGEGNP